MAVTGLEARQEASALDVALRAALAPALPFPEAQPDGTPAGGQADPAWTVRWPAAGELRVEVLANPLNAGNRTRALEAEQEIQKAAMQSQRRSQADYEKAVTDFQQTGRVSEIREISLRDDGVAGERYDADSQLTITAETFDAVHETVVFTSTLPEVLPASGGPAAIVRVASNVYRDAAIGDEPGLARYCPEQAWVFFGAVEAPAVRRQDDGAVALSVTRGTGGVAGRGLVLWITGNAGLVDRVLQDADWSRLRARAGG
jgi:hypothetical protein